MVRAMTRPSDAATTKALKPVFKRALLGTSALEQYALDPKKNVPKPVVKGAGGNALKNTSTMQNVFYGFTVGETPLFLHYQCWQPNKRDFEPGGASLDVFDGAGKIIGNGELDGGKEVVWRIATPDE